MFANPYMLRLKVMALGYISKDIRRDERVCQKTASKGLPWAAEAREFLHNMRTHSLRKEARAANLAYGFFLGRTYGQMEQTCHERPNFARVEEFVERYSRDLDMRITKQRFAQWIDEAREYLEINPPMSEVPPELEPATIDPEIEYLSPIPIRLHSVVFAY